MDDKKRKQIFAGLVIIGISSLIAGGIVPLFINTINLGNSAYLDVDQPTDINDCYATVFSIGSMQKCFVTFSNPSNGDPAINVYLDLIFMSYEDYLYAMDNSYDPENVRSGSTSTDPIYFTRIRINFPANPSISNVDNINNLPEGDSYNIEFTGDGDGTNLYSKPGTYVLVVWADLNGAISTIAGLSVNVEGIGDIINTICSWIGWISLAAAGIFALAYLITRRKR